ncbi:MAG: GNAT family N-acetyltransferase [Chloroflexi bacterium]|nr:GNAT family N-acetyltransferase [Chloroflexota bacterium]
MSHNETTIREITDPTEFAASARVIRNSFKTVAEEFGLTRESAPTHASFLTVRQLRQLKNRPVKFFGLFLDSRQIGFIAVEKADADLYYIEKLAVLPEHRHGGYGAKLVGFAIDYIRGNGGKKVALGMIIESAVLKNWYEMFGFQEISTHKFPGLPFTVCFMERDASPLMIH